MSSPSRARKRLKDAQQAGTAAQLMERIGAVRAEVEEIGRLAERVLPRRGASGAATAGNGGPSADEEELRRSWLALQDEVARVEGCFPWHAGAGIDSATVQAAVCHREVAHHNTQIEWCRQALRRVDEVRTTLRVQLQLVTDTFERTGSKKAAALTARHTATLAGLLPHREALCERLLGHQRQQASLQMMSDAFRADVQAAIVPHVRRTQRALDEQFDAACRAEPRSRRAALQEQAERCQASVAKLGRPCRQYKEGHLQCSSLEFLHQLREQAHASRQCLARLLLHTVRVVRRRRAPAASEATDVPNVAEQEVRAKPTSSDREEEDGAVLLIEGEDGEGKWEEEEEEEEEEDDDSDPITMADHLGLPAWSDAEEVPSSAQSFSAAGVEFLLPPTKSVERAVEKAFDSYAGDFSRVCDVARASLVLDSMGAMAQVLRELMEAHKEGMLQFRRVKLRLVPGYNSALTAGFRDCLLNLQLDGAGEHVCELQLRLRSMQAHTAVTDRIVQHTAHRLNFLAEDDLGRLLREAAAVSDEAQQGGESELPEGGTGGEASSRGGGDGELAPLFDSIRLGKATTMRVELDGTAELGLSMPTVMQLCFALKQSDCICETLVLSNCEIGVDSAKELGSTLRQALSRSLTELDLTGNKLGSEGCIAMAAAADRLRCLKVESNDIGDEGKRALAEAIMRGAALASSVGRSARSNGMTEFHCDEFKMTATATKVWLAGATLRPADALLLAAVLECNASVQQVSVSHTDCGPSWKNDYDESGIIALLTAATAHPQMVHLELAGVRLTDDVVSILAPALQRSRLRTMDLCNTGLSDQAKRALGKALHDGCALSFVSCDHWATEEDVVDLLASEKEMGHADAALLSGMLRHNKTRAALKTVDISANRLGAEGAQDIATALLHAGLTNMDMSANTIGDEGAVALATVLPKAGLCSLKLSDNRISEKGVAALAASLEGKQGATDLTTLDLSFNVMRHGGALSLSRVLDRCGLTSLNLAGCHIGSRGARALASVAARSVTALNLKGNEIGDAGKSALGEVLLDGTGRLQSFACDEWAIDASTKDVDLSMCRLGPPDALLLAGMLKFNRGVRSVNLSTNKLTNYGETTEGIEALCSALGGGDAGLASLDLSSNWLDTECARAVAKLCSCPALTDLNISKNRLGDDGALVIGEALRQVKQHTMVLDDTKQQAAVVAEIARLPRPVTLTFARVAAPTLSTPDLRHATVVSQINNIPNSAAKFGRGGSSAAADEDDFALTKYKEALTNAIGSDAAFRVPFEKGSLGVGFRQQPSGRFQVEDVLEDGQAEKGGVRPGDFIVAVNDVGINLLNMDENQLSQEQANALVETCAAQAIKARVWEESW
jgi:Ran GTPase-activating protein (RanGAP) involved in mRNA processing and transport